MNYVNTLLMSCIKTIVNVMQELIQNVFLKHIFKIQERKKGMENTI